MPPKAKEYFQVSLKVPIDLARRIDKVAEQANLNRSAVIVLMLSMSIAMIERILNPEQWMIDPKIVDMLQVLTKDSSHEESTQKT
jgi:hypothetical protein